MPSEQHRRSARIRPALRWRHVGLHVNVDVPGLISYSRSSSITHSSATKTKGAKLYPFLFNTDFSETLSAMPLCVETNVDPDEISYHPDSGDVGPCRLAVHSSVAKGAAVARGGVSLPGQDPRGVSLI